MQIIAKEKPGTAPPQKAGITEYVNDSRWMNEPKTGDGQGDNCSKAGFSGNHSTRSLYKQAHSQLVGRNDPNDRHPGISGVVWHAPRSRHHFTLGSLAQSPVIWDSDLIMWLRLFLWSRMMTPNSKGPCLRSSEILGRAFHTLNGYTDVI